jgi:DNA gyrase subunit B
VSILESDDFSFDVLSQRLRELSFLNAGLRISIEDERSGKKHEFKYEGGLVSFVEHLNKNKVPVHSKPIYFHVTKDETDLEVALQYNEGYNENIYSFANNINTLEGGTHLVGFKSALTRTVAKIRTGKQYSQGHPGSDRRRCKGRPHGSYQREAPEPPV